MGLKDKLLWSAERAISKAREGFNDLRGKEVPPSETRDHTLESIEPVVQTETSGPTEGPVTSEEPSVIVHEDVPDHPDTEERPVVRSIDMVKRSNRFVRNIGASSREIGIRPPPFGLTIVGLVALVFASLYLMRLLSSLDVIQDDMSFLKRVFSGGVLLFLFYQYISYVITIFRLNSGMRGAWAAMMRTSGSYVILMLLANTHLFDWLPFNLVAFPSWALLLCMGAVMVYMLLPNVRDYYRPPYEDAVPLTAWLAFVFWKDPYGSLDDELDRNIELPDEF